MKPITKSLIAVMIAVIVVAATGCTTWNNFKQTFFQKSKDDSDKVVIGVLEPQTGINSEYGQMEIRGIELAHSIKGEVCGKKIELVYADTQGDLYVTESAVKNLIGKKPSIVLGAYGEATTMLASKYLKEKKIPAIAISPTNPLITSNSEYYFRVGFLESDQGTALGNYTFDKLEVTNAAVIKMQNDEMVTDLVHRYSVAMKKKTGDTNCVTTIELDPKEVNYNAEVQELKLSNVKAVFMPITLNSAEKIFAEAEKLGMSDVTFIGTKNWHTDEAIAIQAKYPKIKIAIASDFSTVQGKGESTEYHKLFMDAYKKKYGNDMPSDNVALAFDAYMLAVNAMEEFKSTDTDMVTLALKNTRNFQGASGEISFDENGDPEKPINIDMIKNKKFYSVYTVE